MIANKARCLRLMKEAGIDAIVISDPYNFAYLTNSFHGSLFGTNVPNYLEYDHLIPSYDNSVEKNHSPGYAVLISDGRLIVVRNRMFAWYTQADEFYEYGGPWSDCLLPGGWQEKDNADTLLWELLKKNGLAGAVIGMDAMRIPSYLGLKAKFPGIREKDARGLLLKCREVKTPEEIARIRRLCLIHADAMNTCLQALKEGDTELDYFTNLRKQVLDEGRKLGSMAFMEAAEISFGLERKLSHEITPNTLRKGDRCLSDHIVYDNGYYSDMQRMFWFKREPAGEEHQSYERILRAVDFAYKNIRPGIKYADIFNEINGFLKDPYYSSTGAGHGVGIQCHERPCLCADNDDLVEENVVMTLEIGEFYQTGVLNSYEDMILVRHDGIEILANLPRYIIL